MILGYNRLTTRNIALERGIVDCATSDFQEFAPLADVIILCSATTNCGLLAGIG